MARKRVALIIETSTFYGRRILRGVRRYVQSHDSWSIFLEQRSLASRPPQWLEGWDGDGMLSRSHHPRPGRGGGPGGGSPWST